MTHSTQISPGVKWWLVAGESFQKRLGFGMLAIMTLQRLEIGVGYISAGTVFFWDDMVLTLSSLSLQFSRLTWAKIFGHIWAVTKTSKTLSYLLYIGDYTTQLYIYIGIMINKSIIRIPSWTNPHNGISLWESHLPRCLASIVTAPAPHWCSRQSPWYDSEWRKWMQSVVISCDFNRLLCM